MSKMAALFTAVVVTAAITAALLVLATMRYPVALVDPPLPVPDYGLQAIIAYSGCLLAVAALVVTGFVVSKDVERRGSIVMICCSVIVGVGVLAAAAALILPAL
jgi:hypothetical protein